MFQRLPLSVLPLLALTSAALQEPDYPEFPGPAGWTVSVDPMREVIDTMNRAARDRHAPFHVDGMGFEVTRDVGPDRSFEDRKILIDYWALQIANLLENEDFQFAEDDEFEALMGMSKQQFRQTMIGRVPYGFRDTVTEQFSEGFNVLVYESPPGCPGDNGYAALVIANYPVRDVASEYGDLAVFLIGAGECASRGASRQRLKQLVEAVRESVVGH